MGTWSRAKQKETKSQDFKSLGEFYEYICNTPLNEVFRWEESLKSVANGFNFTQTKSFDEATDLFKHGWDDQAKKMEKQLQVMAKDSDLTMIKRAKFDVVGFQASVPRYLQGIPTSMINQKQVVQKQKVITITKSVCYSGSTSKEKIVEYSLKALMLIKKIEAQGYRVNLNIIIGTKEEDQNIIAKVRIKNANERLNISKLAFPLVHPSMLRRLFFRYIETTPNVTVKGFKYGYGAPISQAEELGIDTKKEIFLPAYLDDNMLKEILKNLK